MVLDVCYCFTLAHCNSVCNILSAADLPLLILDLVILLHLFNDIVYALHDLTLFVSSSD